MHSEVSEYASPIHLWKKLHEMEVDLTSLCCIGRVGQIGVEVSSSSIHLHE